MAGLLLPALLAAAAGQPSGSQEGQMLQAFCRKYAAQCEQAFEPFIGCSRACPGSSLGGPLCLFRYTVEPLLDSPQFDREYNQIEWQPDELVRLGKQYGDKVVQPGSAAEAGKSAALCFLVQSVHRDSRLITVDRRNLVADIVYGILDPRITYT